MPISCEHEGVDHPLQFYAATKRANELMAHAYSHLFRCRRRVCASLRSTVHGAVQTWRSSSSPRTFSEGKPIKVFNHATTRATSPMSRISRNGVMRSSDQIASLIQRGQVRRPTRILQCPFPHLQHRQQCTGQADGVYRSDRRCAVQEGDQGTLASAARRRARHLRRCVRTRRSRRYKPATPVKLGVARFVEWYRSYKWRLIQARSPAPSQVCSHDAVDREAQSKPGKYHYCASCLGRVLI